MTNIANIETIEINVFARDKKKKTKENSKTNKKKLLIIIT